MATDFDAIAEEIIRKCYLVRIPWILKEDDKGLLSAGLWAGIRHDISNAFEALDSSYYQVRLDAIVQIDASSWELAQVRSCAPQVSDEFKAASRVGYHAAWFELNDLAGDSVFALVVRKLRQLVDAQ